MSEPEFITLAHGGGGKRMLELLTGTVEPGPRVEQPGGRRVGRQQRCRTRDWIDRRLAG